MLNSHQKEDDTPELTAGRAKLQSWLYRTFRIVLTDGRILNGAFLCTDADANVILGMCSEDTKKGGEERMLGLVMVPGRHIVKMEMDVSDKTEYNRQFEYLLKSARNKEKNWYYALRATYIVF